MSFMAKTKGRLERLFLPAGSVHDTPPPEERRRNRLRGVAKLLALTLALATMTIAYAYAAPNDGAQVKGHWVIAEKPTSSSAAGTGSDSANSMKVKWRWVTTSGDGDGKFEVPDGAGLNDEQKRSAEGYGEFYANYTTNTINPPSWQPKIGGVQVISDGKTGRADYDPEKYLDDPSVQALTPDRTVTMLSDIGPNSLIYWDCEIGERTSETKPREAPSWIGETGNAIVFTLYGLFDTFTGGLCGISDGLYGYLTGVQMTKFNQSLNANTNLWNIVMKVSEVVRTVSVGFLGVALVASFMRFGGEVAKRGNGYEMVGSYIWMVGKFVLAAEFIAHSHQLMSAIFEVFTSFTRALLSNAGITTSVVSPYSSFQPMMRDTVTFGTVGYSLIFTLMALVFAAVTLGIVVYVIGLCVGRIIEANVFAAFAGFPLAMMTEQSTKPAGIQFFKNFAAIGIQLAVIFVILSMSSVIADLTKTVVDTTSTQNDIVSVMLAALPTLIATTTIAVLVRQSRTIAAQIVGGQG